MIALPGPRGGLRSSQRPRGPGSAIVAEELTGLRFIGWFDNSKPPCKAFAALREQDDLGVTAFAASKLVIAFERPRIVAYLRRRRAEPRVPPLL